MFNVNIDFADLKFKMSRIFLKLWLILWKNFIIRKRHWIFTLFEITIPIFLCLVMLFVSSVIPKPYISNITNYDKHNVSDLHNFKMFIRLYYAPNTNGIPEFMDKVNNKIGAKEHNYRK